MRIYKTEVENMAALLAITNDVYIDVPTSGNHVDGPALHKMLIATAKRAA